MTNRMDTDAGPWYHEPWPWLLMSGPAVVIVAGFATLYLAVTTEDGLVVDDYYKQGLAINTILAREERARLLGLRATLVFSPQRDGVQVRLVGMMGPQMRLRLRLVHPTRVGQDQSVILAPGQAETYVATLKPAIESAAKAPPQPYRAPEPKPENWPMVRQYLTSTPWMTQRR